jgi:putative FmdB family regulatory protein
MPIYEYKCLSCERHFEKMVRISDPPLEKCDSCGGKVEKQISRTGFQFKGDGWYVTDYAGKSSAKASSGTSESTSSADSASKPAESPSPTGKNE